jgi:ubiquitin C-terminal hydrolase
MPNTMLYICYMNSVLQCLIATPGFSEGIRNFNRRQYNSASMYKGRIASKFADFLNVYNQSVTERQPDFKSLLENAMNLFQASLGNFMD